MPLTRYNRFGDKAVFFCVDALLFRVRRLRSSMTARKLGYPQRCTGKEIDPHHLCTKEKQSQFNFTECSLCYPWISIYVIKSKNPTSSNTYPMPKRVPVMRRRGLLLILNFMSCVIPSTTSGIRSRMHIKRGVLFPVNISIIAKNEPRKMPVHRAQIGSIRPNIFMDLSGSL